MNAEIRPAEVSVNLIYVDNILYVNYEFIKNYLSVQQLIQLGIDDYSSYLDSKVLEKNKGGF